MKQTFEELVDNYIKTEELEYHNDLSYRDWINLMKVVRLKTIEECYLSKESILQLDKNSIEV